MAETMIQMACYDYAEYLLALARKLRQRKYEAIRAKRPLDEIREIDKQLLFVAREMVETEG